MKILKDSEVLRKMFNDSLIMGFVSANTAYCYLNNSDEGTFLIRFSESCLSAITISCKESDGVIHSKVEKDKLNGSAFSEMVFTMINALKYFYPNVNKNEVCHRYISPSNRPYRAGYRPLTYLIDRFYKRK